MHNWSRIYIHDNCIDHFSAVNNNVNIVPRAQSFKMLRITVHCTKHVNEPYTASVNRSSFSEGAYPPEMRPQKSCFSCHCHCRIFHIFHAQKRQSFPKLKRRNPPAGAPSFWQHTENGQYTHSRKWLRIRHQTTHFQCTKGQPLLQAKEGYSPFGSGIRVLTCAVQWPR